MRPHSGRVAELGLAGHPGQSCGQGWGLAAPQVSSVPVGLALGARPFPAVPPPQSPHC